MDLETLLGIVATLAGLIAPPTDLPTDVINTNCPQRNSWVWKQTIFFFLFFFFAYYFLSLSFPACLHLLINLMHCVSFPHSLTATLAEGKTLWASNARSAFLINSCKAKLFKYVFGLCPLNPWFPGKRLAAWSTIGQVDPHPGSYLNVFFKTDGHPEFL